VTPEGKTVWEYVNPVTNRVLKQGETVPLDHRYHAQNAVFKIHRYPMDYPAFIGRNLSPKGLLVENLKNPVSPAIRAMNEHAGKRLNSDSRHRDIRSDKGVPRSLRPDDRRDSGGRDRFRQLDINMDGKISFDEFLAHEQEKKGRVDSSQEKQRFERIDTNHDGSISEQELANEPRGGGKKVSR